MSNVLPILTLVIACLGGAMYLNTPSPKISESSGGGKKKRTKKNRN